MSVLQVYLAWANSVLRETGQRVEGVADLQDGRVLCELVDILAPDAALLDKLQSCGATTQWSYVQTVLDHMKNHGIKFSFSVQDIIDGDIKSLLDVLWLLILNYSIHYIGQNAYQRSVGIGKKHLLEWCQLELDTTFDPRNTLAFNLCTGQWFIALLKKYAGTKVEDDDSVALLGKLMEITEEKYGISQNILSPSDIIDGTVDEHTLMIYIALLRRRIGGDMAPPSRISVSSERLHPGSREASPLSRDASPLSRDSSVDSAASSPEHVKYSSDGELYSGRDRRRYHRVLLSEGRGVHVSRSPRKEKSRPPRLAGRPGSGPASSGDTSDWASSSTGSLFGSENVSPPAPAGEGPDPQSESVLLETISQQVESMLLSGSASSDKEGETTAGEESASPQTRSLEIPSSPRRSAVPPSPRTSSPRKRDEASPRLPEGQSPRRRDVPPSPRRLDGASPSPRQTPLSTQSSDQLKLELPSIIQRSPRSELGESSELQTHHLLASEEMKSSEDTDSIMDGSRLDSLLDSAMLDSISSSGQREASTAEEDSRRAEAGRPRSQSDTLLPASRQLLPPPSGARSRGVHIKRPTDYFHQWEDALDRLSQGPVADSSASDWSRNLSPSSSRPASIPRESPREPPDSGRRHRSLESGDLDHRRVPLEEEQGRAGEAEDQVSSRIRDQQSRQESRSERRQLLQEMSSAMSDPDALLSSSGLSRSLFDELGDNVDVLLLSEAIRRARLEVKESMPDEAAARRQGEDSDETTPMKVAGRDSDQENGSSDGRKKKDKRARERESRAQERERREKEYQEREREAREAEEARRRNELSFRMETKDYVSPRRPLDTLTPAQIRERLNAGRSSPSPSSMNRLSSPADSLGRRSPHLDASAEPASRSSRAGHVPRREAWEQARRRRGEADVVLDASRVDSLAQAKFIEVLTREIEELRHKVDVLERPRSAEPARDSAAQPTGQAWDAQQRTQRCNPYSVESEVHDEGNQMVFETARSRSHSRSRSLSPRRQVALPETSPGRPSRPSPVRAASPRRSPMLSPERVSPSRAAERPSPRRVSPAAVRRSPSPRASPDRLSQSTGTLERGWRYSSLFDPNDLTLPISLGYSSPIRSVTQEIWGHDLDANNPLDLQRKAGWKRLITRRDLSEEDIIELKQSLASAIVENDILHAKLTNGKREIGEKLLKTNDVLDDCRKHLAKSQAENMDLRTLLEQEKQRAEALEGRVQEAENKLFQAEAAQQELERELEETMGLLDKAITENKPGIEALRLENQRLRARINIHYTDNTALRQQLESMTRCYEKSQASVSDLRSCLSEVRKERTALFEEVSSSLEKEQAARVASIMSRYSSDSGVSSDSSSSPTRARSCSVPSPTRLDQRSSTPKPAALASPCYSPTRRSPTRRSPARSPVRHASRSPPRKSPPPRRHAFTTEDIPAPVVPSSFREIYPHRKARYYGQGRGRSLTRCRDYPDLQLYPEKLGGDSSPEYLTSPYLTRAPRKSLGDAGSVERPASSLSRRCLQYGGSQDRLNHSVSDFRPAYLRPRSPSPDPLHALLADEPDLLLHHAATSRRSPLRGRSPSPLSSPDRLSVSFRSSPGRPSPRLASSSSSRSRSVSPGRGRFRSLSPPTRLGAAPPRPTPRRCSPPREPGYLEHPELTTGAKKFTKFSKPRSMSWYEYQFQPPVTLSDAQRRYADHLIAKYTNQHINILTT